MIQLRPIPRFAIVGHPNKGKSSLVATLSQDDSVAISALSGTTRSNHCYPMKVDGEVLYELIDTPGFQRSRAALQWMEQRSVSPADRFDVVRAFLEAHQNDPKFEAECYLLKPVIEGAGVLYVVDGSLPYSSEYYCEMEILRWTGRPRMALINRIGSENYAEQWQRALSQYFSIVRQFNAQSADFKQQIQLLSGFSELDEGWYEPLNQAVTALRNQRSYRLNQSAWHISAMVNEMLVLKIESQCKSDDLKKDATNAITERHESRFREQLREIERACRRRIETLYSYQNLSTEEDQIDLYNEDLFSKVNWDFFGLTKKQLVAAGAISGAAAGGGIDLMLGGASLMAVTGASAVIGGLTALFGGKDIARVLKLDKRSKTHYLTVGPIKNLSFPYVVLGRAIFHHSVIARRTHAQRHAARLIASGQLDIPYQNSNRKQLAAIFAKMRGAKKNNEKLTALLSNHVSEILHQAMDQISSNDDSSTPSSNSGTK